MRYFIFVRSVADEPQYVKTVFLCDHEDPAVIYKVLSDMLETLGANIWPREEISEIGVARLIPNGGYQYATAIGSYSVGMREFPGAWFEFGSERVEFLMKEDPEDEDILRNKPSVYNVVESELGKFFIEMSHTFPTIKPEVIWRAVILAAKFYMKGAGE